MYYNNRNTKRKVDEICWYATETVKRGIYTSARLQIYVHDVKAYTLIETKNGYELKDIKFCPYCGAEIEKEERKEVFNDEIL